jgi:two-component system, OmpR family, alkaline phosphatase synthesis response regulator PhoP
VFGRNTGPLCQSPRGSRPVHRDTFPDRCWGLDYFPESRTLDQHIAQVRRKTEPEPASAPIIETVRSVGYLFRVSG